MQLWCKGSTRASKPLGLGSIPSGCANGPYGPPHVEGSPSQKKSNNRDLCESRRPIGSPTEMLRQVGDFLFIPELDKPSYQGVQYMYSSSYGIGHSKKINAMTEYEELSLSGTYPLRDQTS